MALKTRNGSCISDNVMKDFPHSNRVGLFSGILDILWNMPM
jgi:hypothetical protein